jgi:hypothetical protein
VVVDVVGAVDTDGTVVGVERATVVEASPSAENNSSASFLDGSPS